jgi:CheY-like chemotaxis protein
VELITTKSSVLRDTVRLVTTNLRLKRNIIPELEDKFDITVFNKLDAALHGFESRNNILIIGEDISLEEDSIAKLHNIPSLFVVSKKSERIIEENPLHGIINLSVRSSNIIKAIRYIKLEQIHSLDNTFSAEADYLLLLEAEKKVKRATATVMSMLHNAQTINNQELNSRVCDEAGRLAIDVANIVDCARSIHHNLMIASPYEEVKINDFLKSILDDFLALAIYKGIKVNLYFDTPIPEILLFDAQRARQACSILLQNALLRGEAHYVSIRLKYDTSDYNCIFEVNDRGGGIPDHQLEYIRQYEEDLLFGKEKSEYPFLPAGLILVSQLARSLCGNLKLVSNPDVGNTMKFSFRAKFKEGTKFADYPSKTCTENCSWPFLLPANNKISSSGKILIIESDTFLTNTLEALTTNSSIKVTRVSNRYECLELLSRETYNMIIMDMSLRKSDPLNLVKLIEAKYQLVPIIGVISSSDPNWVNKCILFGCSGCVSLPIRPEKLLKIVDYCLPQNSKSKFDTSSIKANIISEVPTIKSIEPSFEFQEEEVISSDTFLKSLNRNFVIIEKAVKSLDYTTVIKLTNQYAGSSSLWGFPELCDNFLELEQKSRSKNINPDSANTLRNLIKNLTKDKVIENCNQEIPIKQPINVVDNTTVAFQHQDKDQIAIKSELAEEVDFIPLINQFIDGLDENIQRFKQAIDTKNWSDLRAVAHEVAGVASLYGYPQFSDKIGELNNAAKDTDKVRSGLALNEITAMIDSIKLGRPTEPWFG